MDSFLSILSELAEFSELTDNLKANISPLGVTGVSDSVRARTVQYWAM